jgi:hypothetical protein
LLRRWIARALGIIFSGIIRDMQEEANTFNISPSYEEEEDEMPLAKGEETPDEEYRRQRKMAEECCQLGRQLLK